MFTFLNENHFRRQPAFFVFIFYVTGIFFGWHLLQNFPAWPLLILSAICLVLAFVLPRFKSSLLLFMFFFGGMFSIYSHLSLFPPNHIAFYRPQEIQSVSGWIESARFRPNNKNRYVLNCTGLQDTNGWHTATGKIYVYQGKYTQRLSYGNRLILSSRLSRPPLPENPGSFNFRRYLDIQGITLQTRLQEGKIQRLPGQAGNFFQRLVLTPLRRHIHRTVFRYIPQPTAGVVLALLLGERQNLDRDIIRQFQKTGIVHVLAISGLHIGFILMIFLLVFGFLPISYHARVGMALLFLLVFIALTGFKASAVRAGLMAVFYFASKFLERRVAPLNILAVAGLAIVLPFPEQALTPGFQFSFAAVGGILYGYPRLKQIALFNKGPRRVQQFIIQPFLVSLSAVLATTPLTWWYYGSLQTGALLVNIALIPFIGGLVALSFLFILLPAGVSVLLSGLGQFIHFYFSAIQTVNAWFARWPWVQIQMGKPELWVLGCVILLVLLLLRASKQSVSMAAALFVFLLLFYPENPAHVQVTFVNVHQGDGAIIRLPNGKTVVIDGGDRKPSLDAGARYMVPLLRYYGIRHISYVIGTHAHSDHIGGLLAIMQNFPVDTLVLSRYLHTTKLYKELVQTARKRHIPLSFKQRGDQLFLGADYRAYVLHPYGTYQRPKTYSGNEVNNSSLVIQLRYGQTAFLFTGDLERNAEPELASYRRFIHSDVLKAGHHGSKTSSSASFLEHVRPRFSVISVGRHNMYFHPSRTTVARLRRFNAHPLRTDHFGALIFQSDGQTVQPVFWR